MFNFYCELIDWVLLFFWCVCIEMFEVVVEIGSIFYLLYELRIVFGVCVGFFRNKSIKFFGKIKKDCCRFENLGWFCFWMVYYCRDFGVWVGIDKIGFKLIFVVDIDYLCVIFGVWFVECE